MVKIAKAVSSQKVVPKGTEKKTFGSRKFMLIPFIWWKDRENRSNRSWDSFAQSKKIEEINASKIYSPVGKCAEQAKQVSFNHTTDTFQPHTQSVRFFVGRRCFWIHSYKHEHTVQMMFVSHTQHTAAAAAAAVSDDSCKFIIITLWNVSALLTANSYSLPRAKLSTFLNSFFDSYFCNLACYFSLMVVLVAHFQSCFNWLVILSCFGLTFSSTTFSVSPGSVVIKNTGPKCRDGKCITKIPDQNLEWKMCKWKM